MACKSILIVEDEEPIREALKMLLELEGYPVYTAQNGLEGLNILRTIPRPCLVLLDLLMPVMNGMEFLKEKSHEVTIAAIPVCVVSGVADKPDLPNVGAFMKKPIEFDALMKFVRQFCGEERQAVDPAAA